GKYSTRPLDESAAGISGGPATASIIHLHQIESLRRRHGGAGGSVARVAPGREVVHAPAALAHEHQRADHRAHLRMQERARAGRDPHLRAGAHHIEPIERLDRRFALAFHLPESRETVPANQDLRGRPVMASRTVSVGQSLARSTWATWPSACTPVSVRPAPCTFTRSPQNACAAAIRAPCTDRPRSCSCQPMKGVPSYSM